MTNLTGCLGFHGGTGYASEFLTCVNNFGSFILIRVLMLCPDPTLF